MLKKGSERSDVTVRKTRYLSSNIQSRNLRDRVRVKSRKYESVRETKCTKRNRTVLTEKEL